MLLVLALLAGCGQARVDARQAWLVDRLVADNSTWLSRDTRLLEWKYQAMAADPYDWMRGTAGLYFEDIGRPGSGRLPSSFGLGVESGQVLLVGDPHPENFGSYMPGTPPGPSVDDLPLATDELRLEYNDFDAAAFGPWILDLRRGALGLAVQAWWVEGCEADCRAGVIQAYAGGYADEALGSSSWDPTAREGFGAIADALLDEADEEGRERKDLFDDCAEGEDGSLHLVRNESLDEAGEGMLELTAQERAQVERLLAQLPDQLPVPFRELDVVRRFGSGISSLPAVRYVVLWDQGQEGSQDDDLLQLREVVNPPVMPGLGLSIPGLFQDQADRAVRGPRLLWSTPDADPVLAAATDGAMTFKVTSRNSWSQDADHDDVAEDIADGQLSVEDLEQWAGVLGAALAQAHARAPTASNGDAGAAIAGELDGRRDALVQETVEIAEAELQGLLSDHALFVGALDLYGPLLGAELLQDGVGP